MGNVQSGGADMGGEADGAGSPEPALDRVGSQGLVGGDGMHVHSRIGQSDLRQRRPD